MSQKIPHIIIVGGGLAGLAAAQVLAGHECEVTLLESRPRLGGRASSIFDQQTKTWIDNCQHVNMGCCTNYQHFCKTLGIAQYFRQENCLYFIDEQAQISRFESSWLPAPLHLLPAFRKLKSLSNADRKSLARGLQELAKQKREDQSHQTIADWLQHHQQTKNAIASFWQVVLVSALSESLDRISVSAARKVIVDGFLRNRNGWTVQIPTQPLDRLYGDQVIHHLEQQGVRIRMKAGVEKLHADHNHVTGVQLKNGETLGADEFILAVPFQRVHALLPESMTAQPDLQRIAQLEAAPISSVHFWFDREITDLPHAVLLKRLSQWLFNRTRLAEEHQSARQFYYQVVISASREVTQRSRQAVINDVHDELASIWPKTNSAELIHARLITEHHAVFSMLPGVEANRPAQQTAIANLQLAGDWTQTGWPATMEGAVRSGYLAAENILARQSACNALVQPDLPTCWLSKILLGL